AVETALQVGCNGLNLSSAVAILRQLISHLPNDVHERGQGDQLSRCEELAPPVKAVKRNAKPRCVRTGKWFVWKPKRNLREHPIQLETCSGCDFNLLGCG